MSETVYNPLMIQLRKCLEDYKGHKVICSFADDEVYLTIAVPPHVHFIRVDKLGYYLDAEKALAI